MGNQSSDKVEYIPNSPKCFVCGDANIAGLQRRFWLDSGCVVTLLEAKEEFLGHGAVHGGVAAAVIDEAMGLISTIKKNRLCVTAELIIRYVKSLKANGTYTVRGRLAADRKILCETIGEISDKNGIVFVKATGKYVPLSKTFANGESDLFIDTQK